MANYADPNQGYQQPPPNYGGGYGGPPPQQYGGAPYPPQQQQQQYGGYQQQAPMPPMPGGDQYGNGPQTGYGPDVGAPLMQQDSRPIMRVEKHSELAHREAIPFKNFDIDTLCDIEKFRDPKADWQFKTETAVALWVLFNAISTIMIILTNFRRSVTPADRESFGVDHFNNLFDFITYFPLVYFLLVYLVLNNFYSELTFYMYLKRGAIVDYPESSSAKYLFTHAAPLLFILTVLGYLGAVVYTMFKFKASGGVILIYCNNVAVGVCLSWYRQQSIEGKFVSLSNFIQSFPSRAKDNEQATEDGEHYGDIDEQSLHSATMYLQKVTLAEGDAPSWTSDMRLFYWRNKNYSTMQKVFHHLFLVLIIGGMAGACVAYFVILRGIDVKSMWQNEVNPCINVCLDTVANFTTVVADACRKCTCQCLGALGQRDDDFVNTCGEHFGGVRCSHISNACPSFATCKAQWGN